MIVCSCNVLSDGAIKACLKDGGECPRSVREVYSCLGCSPKCGRCANTIKAIMQEAFAAAIACPPGCDCCASSIRIEAMVE